MPVTCEWDGATGNIVIRLSEPEARGVLFALTRTQRINNYAASVRKALRDLLKVPR